MNTHRLETDNDAESPAPLNGCAVTDGTHSRFRTRIASCKESSHGSFLYSALQMHFKEYEHKPVGRPCEKCNKDTIYECYIEVPKQRNLFHYCITCKCSRRPLDQRNETKKRVENPHSTNQDDIAQQSRSSPITTESESLQNDSLIDASSSGIGTSTSSITTESESPRNDFLSDAASSEIGSSNSSMLPVFNGTD